MKHEILTLKILIILNNNYKIIDISGRVGVNKVAPKF